MELLKNYPTELLILLFLIVTFLQSGIDKITDWKGNLSFIKGHFSNSPLKNTVPLLLAVILIAEISASVFMVFGMYQLATDGTKTYALLGVERIICIAIQFYNKSNRKRSRKRQSLNFCN